MIIHHKDYHCHHYNHFLPLYQPQAHNQMSTLVSSASAFSFPPSTHTAHLVVAYYRPGRDFTPILQMRKLMLGGGAGIVK